MATSSICSGEEKVHAVAARAPRVCAKPIDDGIKACGREDGGSGAEWGCVITGPGRPWNVSKERERGSYLPAGSPDPPPTNGKKEFVTHKCVVAKK